MLWVYEHYKYLSSYSAGIKRHLILTTKVDTRAERVKHQDLQMLGLKL